MYANCLICRPGMHMDMWVMFLLSPTLCIWCTRESTGISPMGGCRMAICQTIGRRTDGSWTSRYGVVRPGGDRPYGS